MKFWRGIGESQLDHAQRQRGPARAIPALFLEKAAAAQFSLVLWIHRSRRSSLFFGDLRSRTSGLVRVFMNATRSFFCWSVRFSGRMPTGEKSAGLGLGLLEAAAVVVVINHFFQGLQARRRACEARSAWKLRRWACT